METNIWLAFVLAATVVLVVPGPTILLVMSQAISHGRKSVLPLVIGVILGDVTAMTLSLAGLGAILASSAALFAVLKWIGAIYLVYLGINMFFSRSTKRKAGFQHVAAPSQKLFRSAYVVTALNPKGIVFFVAFMPQFVTKTGEPFFQLVLLGATFLLLAALNAAAYAIFAGKLRDAMTSSRVQKIFNRCGGSALVGAGVVTAALKNAS